jgi:hypothetical protein
METTMTTTNGTPTAAEKLQELNAKLDAALANPDMDVDRHQLRRELDMIAIAEGGEVGRLVARYHKVVESQSAALDASAPRRREEAKVVWEGEFDGFKFVMDADGNLAYGDLNDDGPIVELDRRQAVAMMKFWGDIFSTGVRVVQEEMKAKQREVTRLEHVPLAVNHTIDGVICELRPDGALDLSSTPLGLVRMEPREAYALGMFMRSPAAVALLEAQNALRMTASELGFQQDQAEEGVRMANR